MRIAQCPNNPTPPPMLNLARPPLPRFSGNNNGATTTTTTPSPGTILTANKKSRTRNHCILIILAVAFVLAGAMRILLELWGTTVGTIKSSRGGDNRNDGDKISQSPPPSSSLPQDNNNRITPPLPTTYPSQPPIPSWASLSWVADPTLVQSMIALQTAFRASTNKTAFRPQPLVYRPILKGMGWGNFVYDISYHVSFASWLGRPLIMYLDRKDADGCLGWDITKQPGYAFLEASLIDWRYYPQDGYNLDYMASIQTSDTHVQVTCRPENQWHALCGGNYEGSWDGPYDRLLQLPHKVLYSEYSASFIFPLIRARRFSSWLQQRVIPSRGGNKANQFAYQLRYSFNLVFRVSSKFFSQEIEPHLKHLGPDYLACHIRTGHHETGFRRTSVLAEDVASVKACVKAFPQDREWLVLTDDAALAKELKTLAHTTVDETFSLATMHVGNGESAARRSAWSHTLRDWLLLVYAPGPVLLRSRISSAFSFGERSSLLGWKSCVKRIPPGSPMACGNAFFDSYCEAEKN